MKINNTIAEVQISYSPTKKKRVQVTTSKDAEKCFKSFWNEHISYKEAFYILLLNRANVVLGYHLLSQGGTAGTVVDMKVLLQLLIKSNAHGFIMSHNHPSGNTKPSAEDKHLTTKIKEATKLLDIKLLDHLIITTKSYYSFADELNL